MRTGLLAGLLACVLAGLLAVPAPPSSAGSPPPEPDESPLEMALDALDAASATPSGQQSHEGTGGASDDSNVTDPVETELTLALRDLWLARGDLAPAGRRSARTLLARPSRQSAHATWRYPRDVEQRRTCSASVCVVHVVTGQHAATSQWAQETLAAVEAAWRRVVDQMGYRSPAPDGVEGGDARFDVYLADLSEEAGLYGFCAPENLLPGHDGRASSYCVLDNDMVGLGDSPRVALRATAAHEFFHAVQFNYDVTEDHWFMEATATWIEDQVFPGLRDNRQFLPRGQLGRPTQPLDSYEGRYGNWIFVQFLAQRGGSQSLRQVWERLDASPGARDEWSLQGVRRHFANRGHAWPQLYADFARANFRPRRHYADAAGMRRAAWSDRATVSRRKPRVTRTALLPHLTSHTLRLRTGRLDTRHRALRLKLRATRHRHARVQLLVHRRNGSVTLRRVTLGPRGRAVVRIPRARRVRHVAVLSSHSGADYRNCGNNSGWSCGGDPVGDLRVRVRARLVR